MRGLARFYIGLSFLPWVLFILLLFFDIHNWQLIEYITVISIFLDVVGLVLLAFALFHKYPEELVPLAVGMFIASSFIVAMLLLGSTG